MGIEPISSAWKADHLPLIYARICVKIQKVVLERGKAYFVEIKKPSLNIALTI